MLINRGQVRRARPLLESALARAREPDLRARIEASLAYVAAETGEPDAALAMCDRALERGGITTAARGILANQRALLLMRRGETGSALQAFAEALDALDDPAELGKAHVNRGNVYLQQARPRDAADDYASAVTELQRAGRETDAAMAEHNLGYAAFLAGDMVGALRHMDAARRVLADVSPVVRAIGDQDRAEVLLASGLLTEGTELLRHAARDYGDRRLRQRQGEAELVLARHLAIVDPS
ncbi:tetratricopeptide repeat protein, partial [Nocardioides sp.]|uniref:tetratricopeptide repeat protein n=1 Tax=Nocardioides sp. TaxID=35761 RepID=UPI002ED83E20